MGHSGLKLRDCCLEGKAQFLRVFVFRHIKAIRTRSLAAAFVQPYVFFLFVNRTDLGIHRRYLYLSGASQDPGNPQDGSRTCLRCVCGCVCVCVCVFLKQCPLTFFFCTHLHMGH